MICENVNIVAVVCKKIKCQHFIHTFMFMSTENDTSGKDPSIPSQLKPNIPNANKVLTHYILRI